MGRFVNPDNSAFQVALNSEIYIDKTGLIEYTNRVLNTTQAVQDDLENLLLLICLPLITVLEQIQKKCFKVFLLLPQKILQHI